MGLAIAWDFYLRRRLVKTTTRIPRVIPATIDSKGNPGIGPVTVGVELEAVLCAVVEALVTVIT